MLLRKVGCSGEWNATSGMLDLALMTELCRLGLLNYLNGLAASHPPRMGGARAMQHVRIADRSKKPHRIGRRRLCGGLQALCSLPGLWDTRKARKTHQRPPYAVCDCPTDPLRLE